MSALGLASIVFALVFASAMSGVFIGNALPDRHLSPESKEVVKVGTALIATMAALVLSLLISSAHSSQDRMNEELVENAAKTLALDRTLADYGPETKEIRNLLRRSYAARIEILFPSDGRKTAKEDAPESIVRTENIPAKLWQLSPQDDAHRWLRSQALDIAAQMFTTRWLLFLQKDEPVSMTLLVVLVFWLVIVFATFGLFAPRNAMVVVALFVCSLSVSGAILLILEMNTPFTGLMKLSSVPMRDALANLGQ